MSSTMLLDSPGHCLALAPIESTTIHVAIILVMLQKQGYIHAYVCL